MEKKSRYLIAFSSLLLILVYFLPIWMISIEAPQYPEGMGLYIWINQITGENENDLRTLNGLNHYIGMKEIEPDSIPELVIIPYVILFFLIFGLFNSIKGNKKLILVWIGLFCLMGIVGIYDFWVWEYDYGHNLNPNAPIKVPGMNYQPPLIGEKQLLNINALSLPYIGSFIIFISIALNMLAYFLQSKADKKKQ